MGTAVAPSTPILFPIRSSTIKKNKEKENKRKNNNNNNEEGKEEQLITIIIIIIDIIIFKLPRRFNDVNCVKLPLFAMAVAPSTPIPLTIHSSTEKREKQKK